MSNSKPRCKIILGETDWSKSTSLHVYYLKKRKVNLNTGASMSMAVGLVLKVCPCKLAHSGTVALE